MLRKLIQWIVLPASILTMTIQSQAAEVIKLAHTANVAHVHHEAAQQFAKNVAERTQGKYAVQIYPAGELGDQPALAEQITMSALDMAIVSLGNMAMYDRAISLQELRSCSSHNRFLCHEVDEQRIGTVRCHWTFHV